MMDTEKDKSPPETPKERDTENDRKTEAHQAENDEPHQDQHNGNGDSPPLETVPEAKPKEDESQTTTNDNGEIQGENTPADNEENQSGDVEEQSPTNNEDEDEAEAVAEELPPDLSKVSEEVDQFIANNDNDNNNNYNNDSSSASREGNDYELPKSPPPDDVEGDDDKSPKPPPPDDVHVPIFLEQFASLVEAKLDSYNLGDTTGKWSQLEEENAASLLETVNRISRLSKSLSQFSSEQKYAQSISRIGGVLHRAMSYLEEEFRSYLEDYKFPDPADHHEPADPDPAAGSQDTQEKENSPEDEEDSAGSNTQDHQSPPAEDNINFPSYPEDTVSNLNKLAQAMIFGGYETECWQVYIIARRNALEESLRRLGFEKHSIDDVQKMNWELVEREISAWISTFSHCNVIFSCERKLTDAVFHDITELSELPQTIFTGLSRGLVIQFLIFPEAVAMTKPAAEKLFKFLDLYEAMRDIWPAMYANFLPEYVAELKAEATLTRDRLGEAMVGIFIELESSIKTDSGKTPVPGGAVHPLTRYTMNYLKLAGDYKDTLEQVFREHQKIDRADSATGSDFDYNSQPAQSYKPPTAPKQSPLEVQITKVMDLLDANLDHKSKLYKDLSLCSIFMMNNGRYILQKVKGSPQINSLMGDHWYRKRSSDLRQYHKTYQRETWGRLLQCLSIDGLSVHGKVNKPVLKERFKSFNAVFDEIHKTQSTWVISDEQLQSELRVSICNMVVPAYRSFLARYSQTFTPGRQTEKYVKYQAEDIETYIDELFDGNAKK